MGIPQDGLGKAILWAVFLILSSGRVPGEKD